MLKLKSKQQALVVVVVACAGLAAGVFALVVVAHA
jgi:hypothetical protein